MTASSTAATIPERSVADTSPQTMGRRLSAYGEPGLWLMGGGLVIALAMIVGILGLILVRGLQTFSVSSVVRLKLYNGQSVLGEVARSEWYHPDPSVLKSLSQAERESFQAMMTKHQGWVRRLLVRTGNFELTNEHFRWVAEPEIQPGLVDYPQWALVLERRAWGRFYGSPVAFVQRGRVLVEKPDQVWQQFKQHHPEVDGQWALVRRLETQSLGDINYQLESLRLRLRSVELAFGKDSPRYRQVESEVRQEEAELQKQYEAVRDRIERLRAEMNQYAIRLQTVDGQQKDIALADIVRAYPANQLQLAEKAGLYLARLKEFLTDEPREANSEGGIFPAIFGTVFLTLLMTVAVVPLGVLASLFLREYAKEGVVVSTVRIAVNNLAGVPSIVFGVFGLGFFCYMVGGTIDQLFFSARLPNPTFGTGGILWASLTLALLTLPVVIVATEEALAAVPRSMREGSYACGATRWQTIRRIVLPRAMPGVLTGAILAMARGAGEVAPLMLVGAVKLAPELPFDHRFPYIHLQRSFMHLGFHIYDLGFQSPNSEAAKPMLFSTALLLILLIGILNAGAFVLRSRLRRSAQDSRL